MCYSGFAGQITYFRHCCHCAPLPKIALSIFLIVAPRGAVQPAALLTPLRYNFTTFYIATPTIPRALHTSRPRSIDITSPDLTNIHCLLLDEFLEYCDSHDKRRFTTLSPSYHHLPFKSPFRRRSQSLGLPE